MFVVALIAREWVLAGLAAFVALYAGLVMAIKYRRSRRTRETRAPSDVAYDPGVIPRRNLITAGVLLLLAVIWSIGTHDYTALLGGALFFASLALFLWLRIRGGGGDS